MNDWQLFNNILINDLLKSNFERYRYRLCLIKCRNKKESSICLNLENNLPLKRISTKPKVFPFYNASLYSFGCNKILPEITSLPVDSVTVKVVMHFIH